MRLTPTAQRRLHITPLDRRREDRASREVARGSVPLIIAAPTGQDFAVRVRPHMPSTMLDSVALVARQVSVEKKDRDFLFRSMFGLRSKREGFECVERRIRSALKSGLAQSGARFDRLLWILGLLA